MLGAIACRESPTRPGNIHVAPDSEGHHSIPGGSPTCREYSFDGYRVGLPIRGIVPPPALVNCERHQGWAPVFFAASNASPIRGGPAIRNEPVTAESNRMDKGESDTALFAKPFQSCRFRPLTWTAISLPNPGGMFQLTLAPSVTVAVCSRVCPLAMSSQRSWYCPDRMP